MQRSVHLLFSAIAITTVTAFAPSAHATPEVRAEFSEPVGLPPKSLPCSTCHEYANTGIGSVRTPFGLAVRSRGLDIESDDLPGNAIEVRLKMEADRVDSDGDGVQDMVELKNNTDPNTYGPVPLINRDEVGNGCHCQVGTTTSSTSGALCVIGLGLALVSVRRATRRGRLSRA